MVKKIIPDGVLVEETGEAKFIPESEPFTEENTLTVVKVPVDPRDTQIAELLADKVALQKHVTELEGFIAKNRVGQRGGA